MFREVFWPVGCGLWGVLVLVLVMVLVFHVCLVKRLCYLYL